MTSDDDEKKEKEKMKTFRNQSPQNTLGNYNPRCKRGSSDSYENMIRGDKTISTDKSHLKNYDNI